MNPLVYLQAIHAHSNHTSSLANIKRSCIVYSAALVRQLLQQESVTCDRLAYWMTGDECVNICLSNCHYVAIGPWS
jgi:hypothetical protein